MKVTQLDSFRQAYTAQGSGSVVSWNFLQHYIRWFDMQLVEYIQCILSTGMSFILQA